MHHFPLNANKGVSRTEFRTQGCQGYSDFQTGTFDFRWCSRSWTQKLWPPRDNGTHHYICWLEKQKAWGCAICGDCLGNMAPAWGLRQQCCPCQQRKGHDREEMLVRSMPGGAASRDLDIPWIHLKCSCRTLDTWAAKESEMGPKFFFFFFFSGVLQHLASISVTLPPPTKYSYPKDVFNTFHIIFSCGWCGTNPSLGIASRWNLQVSIQQILMDFLDISTGLFITMWKQKPTSRWLLFALAPLLTLIIIF